MLKFDENAILTSVNGALALRPQVEKIVDQICADGFENLFFVGIGGTYASCMQTVTYMAANSTLNVYVENAAELLTSGNRKFGPKSVMIISSVTGSTEEMVRVVDMAKTAGVKIFGFIDVAEAELAKKMDYLVAYPMNEQLKLLMTAHRFIANNNEFADYKRFYDEMDKHLAKALVATEKKADAMAVEFVREHHDDPMHYFVGAGSLYGAVYSYAMCFWEEQHWRRSKSIHSAEFLHGTLEIIDRDSAVTVFIGEDEQRELGLRVARFLPRICGRYTIIDTKDYELAGISPEFRGLISHLVFRAIIPRIDAHMEHVNRHPVEIRRYYRRLEY